ncbi:MAG: DUF1080 domain-containing protein [Melioribacteraceae bacterium]|nr:DUF1080 domain-containing protein [Melioribacteraceae bacterium]
MRTYLLKFTVIVFFIFISTEIFSQTDSEKSKATEVWEPVPEIITPGNETNPPSDAIILLGNTGMEEWEHKDGSAPGWQYQNGIMTVEAKIGDIKTKRKFGDCQLHIEWRSPKTVEKDGQARGNSGIFLQGRYEVQVLDSYDNRTYSNGQAGSIYKQYIPLVNASKGPGEWQTYDIIFHAPRFDENKKLESPGYITVIHNGVLIQNHVEIKGSTVWIGQPFYESHDLKESIMLQDHGDPVSFRNIWIREL